MCRLRDVGGLDLLLCFYLDGKFRRGAREVRGKVCLEGSGRLVFRMGGMKA